jgi:hypothetical protein
VRVLETPDQEIAAAVKDAVSRWSFLPFQGSDSGGKGLKRLYAVRSRVVFYFRLVDGKPVIIDAGAEAAKEVNKTVR